ncbi:MAG: hypothetical protein II664_01705 [Oscillospiraceae bacterium]|nr:hypothetical protein [Oscillospiraceae bacterium]
MISKIKKISVDRDMIKYLAVIPMVIGHFCGYLSNDMLYKDMHPAVYVLMQTALFAPPVFFFFISEGFRYTRSRKKYAVRLLIFALINQVPFCLANYGTLLTTEFFLNLNIIFTLLLGLISIMIWETKLKTAPRIILIVLLDALTFVLTSEWMIFGIPIILGFHIFRDRPKERFIWFLSMVTMQEIMIAVFGFSGWFYTLLGTFITFASMMAAYYVIFHCYSGEKGKHPAFAKWFFYIIYPVHLWVIYIVLYVI